MFDILQIVPRPDPIKVIDVGAMSMGEGVEDIYAPLLKAGLGRVVGFEPIQAECDKRNAMAQPNQTFLPYAIGDGTQRTFHLCNMPMTSSLYEPDTALRERFQTLAELAQVVERSPIQTHRLDDIPEVADADLIKLDVQGAELDVIRGGPAAMASAVVVHTEVEFIPLYKNQPLFAEVDQEMRRSGYLFHLFHRHSGRAFKPVMMNNNPNQFLSQWIWSDAVYVKSFLDFEKLAPEKLLKLAIILHMVYGSFDLCVQALKFFDRQSGTSFKKTYLARLFNNPAA